jgi:hypothetical protein
MHNIKAAIGVEHPVVAVIKDMPCVILGYNDDKQALYVRSYLGRESWVPYLWVDDACEAFVIEEKRGV